MIKWILIQLGSGLLQKRASSTTICSTLHTSDSLVFNQSIAMGFEKSSNVEEGLQPCICLAGTSCFPRAFSCPYFIDFPFNFNNRNYGVFNSTPCFANEVQEDNPLLCSIPTTAFFSPFNFNPIWPIGKQPDSLMTDLCVCIPGENCLLDTQECESGTSSIEWKYNSSLSFQWKETNNSIGEVEAISLKSPLCKITKALPLTLAVIITSTTSSTIPSTVFSKPTEPADAFYGPTSVQSTSSKTQESRNNSIPAYTIIWIILGIIALGLPLIYCLIYNRSSLVGLSQF